MVFSKIESWIFYFDIWTFKVWLYNDKLYLCSEIFTEPAYYVCTVHVMKFYEHVYESAAITK